MAAILQPGGRTKRVTEEWMQSPTLRSLLSKYLLLNVILMCINCVKSLMAKLFPVLLLRSQSLPRRRLRGV